jgi:uncharacterized protein YdhG (YjbR/CyaY superfamily)
MTEVETYLSNVTAIQRAEYRRIRTLVSQLVPEFEEVISYAIPTFNYKGKPLLYFGAFKNHMSIFPTPSPVEAIRERLTDYKVSKGTIQFTDEKPLPDDVLKDLILLRKQSIDGTD